MSTKSDNKSLELLINRFTDVSQQVKELDTVVRSFSDVANDLKSTIDIMEESFAVQEISKHSRDAVAKLKEVKALNEVQILDKLESIVNKELSKQLKPFQTKLDQTLQSSAVTQTQLKEIQSLRKQRERNNSDHLENDSYENEVAMLKKMVGRLTTKVNKMEEDYELRIIFLENEVEMLREQLEGGVKQDVDVFKDNGKPLDVWDDDLPF
ncbi:hypothetical protein D3C73_571140 [compost metagenome]